MARWFVNTDMECVFAAPPAAIVTSKASTAAPRVSETDLSAAGNAKVATTPGNTQTRAARPRVTDMSNREPSR